MRREKADGGRNVGVQERVAVPVPRSASVAMNGRVGRQNAIAERSVATGSRRCDGVGIGVPCARTMALQLRAEEGLWL